MMQSSSSDAFVKEKLSLLVTSTRPINLTKFRKIQKDIVVLKYAKPDICHKGKK